MSNLTKNRWYILIATIVVNICIGTAFAWSVFQAGLFLEAPVIFKVFVSKQQLALAFTICSGVSPICMILGPTLQKKLGSPRIVIWAGGILFGLGLILSGFISKLWMLYITYGIVCGFGSALAYGITISNTVRLFPDKKGLASGLVTAAFGAGAIIFPPVINSLINSSGTLYAFKVLGVLFIVLVFIAGFFIKEAPANFVPDNFTQKANLNKKDIPSKNWKEMLKDLRFYIMIAIFTIFATAGLMLISQGSQISQAVGHIKAEKAALIVSIIAIGNTLGRLIFGFISDKIGANKTLLIMTSLVTVCSFILYFVIQNEILVLFIIFAVIVAMCYGGSMGVYPALTPQTFGLKYNGVNYGIMFIGFALGSYFGPVIANSLFEVSSSYALSLLVVGFLGLLGFILVNVFIKVNKIKSKEA